MEINPVTLITVTATVSTLLLFLTYMFKEQSRGRILCQFREKDKSLTEKLLKPGKTGLVELGSPRHNNVERYAVRTDRILLMRYPRGLPGFLQSIVPTLVYVRNNPEPLDLPYTDMDARKAEKEKTRPDEKLLTAKDLGNVFDQHVLEGLVKAARDLDEKKDIPIWVVGIIGGLGSALTLGVLILLVKMNSTLGDIAQVLKLSGG